jgi:hypothetical protein
MKRAPRKQPPQPRHRKKPWRFSEDDDDEREEEIGQPNERQPNEA